ncbi:hypothetical protein EELLY_v1c04550 [Entomoplasma ellychniae]|uniref:Uncharacterized protein n=1 Tax=Entomoplasma ellychniae TaxID=2114 RepID=A0A8E2QY76_9MOLU|nr:hypothetical protein [Entomoplasma ellychniae]PPE04775.1 hypothetical protein EELLY_v1c04550 [Entomoplasma ellychniae]
MISTKDLIELAIMLVAIYISALLVIFPLMHWAVSVDLKVKYKLVGTFISSKFDLDNFPIILKGDKEKLLTFYFWTILLSIITYVGFLFFIPSDSSVFKFYIIAMSISLLLALILVSFFIYRVNKKLKLLKLYSKKYIIEYFKNEIKKHETTSEYKQFTLYNEWNEKFSFHNWRIQFQQRRFQKKLKASNLKNDYYKQFKLFLKYLRINAYFISQTKQIDSIKIKTDNQEISIKDLKSLLVENFIAMLQNS